MTKLLKHDLNLQLYFTIKSFNLTLLQCAIFLIVLKCVKKCALSLSVLVPLILSSARTVQNQKMVLKENSNILQWWLSDCTLCKIFKVTLFFIEKNVDKR